MATPIPTETILTILRREIACHFYELVNRAYLEYHITKDVDAAYALLYAHGKADETYRTVPSVKPKPVRIIYCTQFPPDQIERVITEKAMRPS